MKKFAILKSDNKRVINSIVEYFGANCELISETKNLNNYKLLVLTGYESEFNFGDSDIEVLNLHPSLLPSFIGENSIKESFLSGIKVGGVSVHRVEKNNFYGHILAQYPVLIGLTSTFNDYCDELEIVGAKLYPHVIEAVVKDKVFDFGDLFKSSCQSTNSCNHGKCTHCSGCKKHCG